MEDSEELVAFCREVYPRLVGALSLHCGDAALAEELADETIARVCRDWRRVRHAANPAGWAYRCAVNLASSHFRRLAAERRARARLSGGASVHDDPDVATAVTVRTLVSSLPRREKTVLVLRYYLDLSVRDTADVMGCPEGTVKTLARRAAQTIRREAGPELTKEVASGTRDR